jgi:DNA-binding MarR family transcriptional regulator
MRKPPNNRPIPAAGEGKRGEEGYLGYLLRQASVAVRARMERVLADIDVTLPQFVVLTMTGAYPGLSNADLARLSFLTPQTVSVIVANLKRVGAIVGRPHPVHGRIQQLTLTDRGRETLDACRVRVQTVESRLLDGLSESEEEIIRSWLVRIAVDVPEVG